MRRASTYSSRRILDVGDGFANAAWRIPSTLATRFKVAPMSKTFTATSRCTNGMF